MVRQLQWLFAENWERTTGENIRVNGRFFPPLPFAGDMTCGAVGAVKEGKDRGRIREMWLLPLAASRDYFYMTLAYFIPDPDTLKALREASRRGVDIRLIVPGTQNDIYAVRMVSRKYYQKLLDAGIRIYEYKGTNMHSKTGVCDDIWSTVGSSNYDNRSFNYNYESNLVIYNAGFAKELKKVFEDDLKHCVEVDPQKWENRPIPYKFLEQIIGVVEGWL